MSLSATSYRQIGQSQTGQLMSGSHSITGENLKKTAPSIPGKFEPKKERTLKERNGFGGRTTRFTESGTSLPVRANVKLLF